jgi:translation initiation factor 2B subunit (eIF-2B alpha/beta/delta family)
MGPGDYPRFLEELRRDREQGASALARACLRAVASSARDAPASESAGLRRLLIGRAGELAGIRPTMAPIANLLGRWQAALDEVEAANLAEFRAQAAALAEALVSESEQALEQAAARACQVIGPDRCILTHSLSASVLACFRLLRNSGVTAIVSESRPLNEGRRLAEQLAGWAIPVSLITDAQLGLFAAEADLALIGADRVLADGGVVNKAGSYLLALAARDQGIPFYVCCEGFKAAAGLDAPLEEMAGTELGYPECPGILPRNTYFDITPARLISAFFTERGGSDHWVSSPM